MLYENGQKAACANKLWLVPQNVIGLDIWLLCQIKLVVRVFKNTQNLKIVKMWVSSLVHDAIHFIFRLGIKLPDMAQIVQVGSQINTLDSYHIIKTQHLFC